MLDTPGSSAARDVQSRPFSGSSRTVVASTVELMVDEDVCTSGGAEFTSTVWLTCPTLRARLSACSAPTFRVSPFCTTLEKPSAGIVTSYSPGRGLGAQQKPSMLAAPS